MNKAYLILSNGMVFEGERFGACTDALGELVFTTNAGAYQKNLTDPNFFGQIVMETFPVVGGYGIISEDISNPVCASGYVVREYCDFPSNFRTDMTLDEFLKKENIPGICGIDTRELTRIIRENGVMNAAISSSPSLIPDIIKEFRPGSFRAVNEEKKSLFPEGKAAHRAALINYGSANSLIAHLLKHGYAVDVYPGNTPSSEILSAYADGIILSGGPGDPSEKAFQIEQIKHLLGKAPIFAEGLGHQLLAIAMGAKTFKLKYGHRGSNQPVREQSGKRTHITNQNHGYAVESESLPALAEVSYINMNDKTIEGINYPSFNAFSVQFEAASLPELFDKFSKMMEEK